MPNNNNANLFALVDDEESPVRRIPLTAELSAELAQLFAAQQNALLDGKQAIDFTGSYNVDHGEIFTIAAYPLPPAIGQTINNPLTNSRVLNLKNETHRIKALFSGTWTVARAATWPTRCRCSSSPATSSKRACRWTTSSCS